MNIFKKIFPDPLLFYLLVSLILAYFLPELSEISFKEYNLQNIIDIGVMAVFFFYGLKLKWNEVFRDLKNWKLHVRIQAITFCLFPILGLLFYPIILINENFYLLFLAIFYLCCLPSTVSSSVVMVSMAHGNVTSAIFNASLSGLLGIVITPLLMSFFIRQNGDVDSFQIFLDLIISVILPVVLGALCKPFLGKFYEKYKNVFSNIDKLTIVLIVYVSFSHTFHNGLITSVGYFNLFLTIVCVVSLFIFVFYFIQYLNKAFWKYKKSDFITLQFCGTKKSLVHGSVMAGIIFGKEIGFILLPIMIYHTFQLMFISYKASQYAKKME